MKKWLSLILAVIMTLSLAACASSTPANETAEPSETQPAATEPVTTEAPTTEAPATTEEPLIMPLTVAIFRDEYFAVVASYTQGISGASLKMAKAAYNAVKFAADHADAIAQGDYRDELLYAWNELSEEDRQLFDYNFMDIVRLIDEYNASYQTHQDEFEDAGVAEQMQALLEDKASLDAWNALKGSTLTMGNSNGE